MGVVLSFFGKILVQAFYVEYNIFSCFSFTFVLTKLQLYHLFFTHVIVKQDLAVSSWLSLFLVNILFLIDKVRVYNLTINNNESRVMLASL